MNVLGIALQLVGWGMLLFGVYFMIRNQWVFDATMKVLKDPTRPPRENLRRHGELPNYDTLLYKYPFTWSLKQWLPEDKQ